MKCEIIQDLMPSYIDEITGPESTREIEAHLEHCEKCRAYRDSMKKAMVSEVSADKSAEEIKPFKKARNKIRLLTVLLLSLIVIVCGGLLAYQRYVYYYCYGNDTSHEDIHIKYNNISLNDEERYVTLYFLPTKENLIIEAGYTDTPEDSDGRETQNRKSGDIYIGFSSQRLTPFSKNTVNPTAKQSYLFLNETTLFDPKTAEITQLTGDERVVIEYDDGTKTSFYLKDLYSGEGMEEYLP